MIVLFEAIGFILLIGGCVWLMYRMVNPLKGAEPVKVEVDPLEQALSEVASQLEEMKELRKTLILQEKTLKLQVEKSQLKVNKWENLARTMGIGNQVENVRVALENKAEAEKQLELDKRQLSQISQQENDLCTKIAEIESSVVRAKADKGFLEASLKINKLNAGAGSVFSQDSPAMEILDKLRQEVQVTGFEAKLAKGEEIQFGSKSAVTEDDIAKYLK